MKSVKCQSCGFISANCASCKKCGAPIAVERRAFEPRSSPSALAWRDRDKLVMDLQATLPDRCVVCNASAGGKRFPLSLSYNHKLSKLSLLVGSVSVSYKEVELPIGLCAKHLSGQKTNFLLGLALIVVGAIVFFIALFKTSTASSGYVLIGGIMTGVVISSIGALFISQKPIEIENADETRFWVKGVSADYLAKLPQWTQNRS